jgi:acetyl esterase
MPVHPQVPAFLKAFYQANPASRADTPIEQTRRLLIEASVIPPDCPAPARSVDRMLAGKSGDFRIRIHTPPGTGPFGVCCYFHGGGWVLGSIETHDDVVRRLVAESGCVFISVEYPLAPEHKYPAGLEDSYLALQWVRDHASELNIDPNRLTVAGDSAGGNIAAALCLMARDRGDVKIAAQVLNYPITDCDFDRPSYQEYAEGYLLGRRDMQWFWRSYVEAPEQMTEPYASPLRAASLAGLPAALVVVAECDPLCDEGVAFAKALEAAGVPTTLRVYPGMIHGFIKRYNEFDDARTATREIGMWLKSKLVG